MRYLLIIFFLPLTLTSQKICPDCWGAASSITGGRGKKLGHWNTGVKSTTLTYDATSDTYSGGYYELLQSPDVGYIVPNFSGNVNLGVGGTTATFGGGGIPNIENKTVFGQLAPEGGVTLTGGTHRWRNPQNVMFQYIRSRPKYNRDGGSSTTDDAHTWGLLMFEGDDIYIKNCSFSFAQDKGLGAYLDENSVPERSVFRHTYDLNLITDSGTGYYLALNVRPDNVEDYVGNHSMLRNVTVSMNRTPNLSFSSKVEKINNYAYDVPSKQSTMFYGVELNDIANYSHTFGSSGTNRISDFGLTDEPLIYVEGNLFESSAGVTPSDDQKRIWRDGSTGAVPPSSSYFTGTKHVTGFPNPYVVRDVYSLKKYLIEDRNVGANRYMDNDGNLQFYMDSFDTSQLDIVENGQDYTIKNESNWVIPTIPTSTRSASYDTDNDGLADAWEMYNFGDLDESYGDDPDSDGYENIEEFAYGTDPNSSGGIGGEVENPGGGEVEIKLGDKLKQKKSNVGVRSM